MAVMATATRSIEPDSAIAALRLGLAARRQRLPAGDGPGVSAAGGAWPVISASPDRAR